MRKDEKGSVTIEATIVVTTSLLVLFMMIEFGMILYRQSLVTAVANQTASDMAMIYPYLDKDPNTGFTGEYDFSNSKSLYRYFLWKAEEYKEGNKEKAEWYANALLEKGSLSSEAMEPSAVRVEITAGNALRRNITVSITDNYQVPLAKAFTFFGLPDTVEIHAVATAECVDMIDYMNTTNLLNYMVDKATPFSDLLEAVDKWITWAKKLKEK